jgi:hypothetical protein
MTPQQFLNKVKITDNDLNETEDKKRLIFAEASYYLQKSREHHAKAISRTRVSRNKGCSNTKFEVDDLVFIKPPARYQKNSLFPYSKKGLIKEMNNNIATIEFQETGGWLESHKVGTIIDLHTDNLNKYVLGKDIQLTTNKTSEDGVPIRSLASLKRKRASRIIQMNKLQKTD